MKKNKKKITARQREKRALQLFEWFCVAVYWLLLAGFIWFLYYVYCSKLGLYE